jgi:hypothetical protein
MVKYSLKSTNVPIHIVLSILVTIFFISSSVFADEVSAVDIMRLAD